MGQLQTGTRGLKKLDFVTGFVSSLVVVVIETLILITNIDLVSISSIYEFVSSPLRLGIYLTYILSIILVPIASLKLIDFVRRLREVYKQYVTRSLNFESLEVVEKYAKFIPMMISASLMLMIVGMVLRFYVLLFTSLIPLSLYLALILKPVYDVYAHRKNIESELPWFLILLIVIERVKANIKLLIERLRYTRVLPAITKELLVIDRDSKLYSYSHISALMNRTSVTPSNRLSNIFSGYASRLRSGGDALSWLRSRLVEELMVSEFSVRLYSERMTSTFGQLMLAIYAILPLISVAILALNIYVAVSIAVVSTPLLVALVYISRPKSLNSLPITKIAVLQLMYLTASSLILYRIAGAHAIAIGWVLTLVLTYKYRSMYREVEILDRDSIEIVKIVAELRQSGFDVAKALGYIASSNIVHDVTAKKLKTALLMLQQGVPLTFVATRVSSYSFLFKFTLFTLGIIYECGSGDSEVFQMLYEYITKVKTMNMYVEKMSRFFELFAFINVVVLAWIWKSLLPLRESFAVIGLTNHSTLDMSALYLMIYISLIGFSLVSNTVRRGAPILELRNLVFLLLSLAVTSLFIT